MKTKTKDLSQTFDNKDLFDLARTHKSWVNEHKGARESNERLEFLGDAVLEFIVSYALYKKYPQKEEGYLTALRANLVNTVSLAKIAAELNIGESLFLSKGEEEGGGRKNPTLLANTVEAIIGAYFLDGGIKKAEAFIQKHLLKNIDKITAKPLKDAKSRLQEVVQAQGLPAPKYEVVREKGPDHNKSFTVGVFVNGKSCGTGVGKSKSEAEQDAATIALKNFD
jgi:ribonuclease-3